MKFLYLALATLFVTVAHAQTVPPKDLCQIDVKQTGLVDIYIVRADNVRTDEYGQKVAIDPSRREYYSGNYLFRNHLHDALVELDKRGICNASQAILEVRWEMNPRQPGRMSDLQPSEDAQNVDKTLTTPGINLSPDERSKLEAARQRLLALPASADDVHNGIHRNFACLMVQVGFSFGGNVGVCVEATSRHTPTTVVFVGWGMKGVVATGGIFRLEYIGDLVSLNGDSFATTDRGSGGGAIVLGLSGEMLYRQGGSIEISGMEAGLGLIIDMEGFRVKLLETTTTSNLQARVQQDGFYLP